MWCTYIISTFPPILEMGNPGEWSRGEGEKMKWKFRGGGMAEDEMTEASNVCTEIRRDRPSPAG